MDAKISHIHNHTERVASTSKTVPPHTLEVADLLVAYLEQIGIEYIFGVPGGAIEPLFNAMARSQRRGGLRPIVARHEAGAAFMADGYARETGRLGVCCATSGPGSTNMITGVACAHDNNVPLLAISGLPILSSFGRGALQESSSTGVNAFAMFDHCTRYNAMISHPGQFERKLTNALTKAHHAPGGSVHLAIPLDILRAAAPSTTPTYDLAALHKQEPVLIDIHAVLRLKQELVRSPRVVFVIGASCIEAIEAIMLLVKLTDALFVTTPDAKGYINPRHKAYCGVFGMGGHSSAHNLLSSAPDIVLAFGTGFSEFVSGGWCDSLLNERLVHIDNSENNLMRSPMALLHVRGNIRAICKHLIGLLKDDASFNIKNAEEPLENFSRNQAGVTLLAPESYSSEVTPIKPQRLMKTLSERCPPDTRFLADSGNSMVWTTHYLQPRDRRIGQVRTTTERQQLDQRSGTASWLRVMMDFCPMGWAIGAAVGIARGNPACPVVCITGDGAFLMSGQEITVAAMEGLTVVFVVLNDSALGMVKHGQRLAGAEAIGYELPQVDYCKLAEAMGIPGHVIRSPQELDDLDFDTILQRKGPTLLDVRIDGEEVPPMMLRMKTLGTLK
ncbi:MAG: acetolactate synthase I/II/III large [Gallionellaceae bacterium]|nr:MAG: acetolactate synthase I/II/III large [Gallionellaceae bacterium]